MVREGLSYEVTFSDMQSSWFCKQLGRVFEAGAQQVRSRLALFSGRRECQQLWSTADLGEGTPGET